MGQLNNVGRQINYILVVKDLFRLFMFVFLFFLNLFI